MPAKLKVYTAPIGFHDVTVAAPSKAAALRAWGSEHDLFARGIASVVTDAKLAEAALAEPGKVIRRLRGTAAEQLAALPPDPAPPAAKPAAAKAPARRAKPVPKPDHAEVDRAERALAELGTRQADETRALDDRQAELERQRRALRDAQAADTRTLECARDAAAARYDAALERWRAG